MKLKTPNIQAACAVLILIATVSESVEAQTPDILSPDDVAKTAAPFSPLLATTQITKSKTITLKDALRATLSHHPQILIAKQEYAISETDIRLAKSGKKPTIEATGSYGFLDQNNSFTSAPEQDFSGDTSNVGISVRQPIFRGFQTQNAVKRATSASLSNEVRINALTQQIFLEVVTAYYDVKRDATILDLNLENLETLQEQLKANEKRYELKDASLTDLARSRSAVASAYSQIAGARSNFAATQSNFFRLTGLSPQFLDISSSSFSTADQINIEARVPASVETFLTQAISKNAAILSSQYTVLASDYAVKEAKGARLPTVDFNSSVTRGARPENFGLFSDRRTSTIASATVSISVPLYQADQEFGNIKRAKQIKQLRELELTQVIADVRNESRIIWDRLEETKIALDSHEKAVEAANTAATGTRKIYRAGLISAIDLIDTEQILLDAKINYEQSWHDYYVAAYTVLSIMGDIDYN